jgi:flagellar M-ring protein FliF
MNEIIKKYANNLKNFWKSRTGKQKGIYFGSLFFLIAVIAIASYFTFKTTFVPLYSNLSPSEAGSIQQSLDSKGVKSELADSGTTIKVPDNLVDSLKVQLAAAGLPKTGSIDYSFFSQNAGLGTTDNEFNMIKLDAMQTELANLIQGIEGVQDAKVMINLPDKGIFVTDKGESASASIVLTVKQGYQFSDAQIKGLYQLVSKSVPNLPTSNIVIMNQYFEYFDLNNKNNSIASSFTTNNDVKKQIERDIQQQVQTMLGTLMGPGKAVVSVSADIDFTQEKQTQDLVEPVDKSNMKGIAISAENIKEAFTGNGAQAGGTPQTETTTDSTGSNYLSGSGSNGDYEKTDDKVNYEVNRIHKQISESPYKIRDLGIQVLVEPPNPQKTSSLSKSTVNDITNILGTIVRTSIDKSSLAKPLTNQDIKNKIVVSVQPFKGGIDSDTQTANSSIPWWIYAIGGILLAALAVVLFLFLRSRNSNTYAEEPEDVPQVETIHVPDVNEEQENESTLRRKQLEKMAKEHPEDFAKLLRTWIAED